MTETAESISRAICSIGAGRARHGFAKKAMRHGLSTLTVALLVACGGGGEDGLGGRSPSSVAGTPASAPTNGPAPVAPPAPTPGPGPAPVSVAASCAAPVTAAGPGQGGEAASDIGQNFDVYASCQSVYQGQRISFHLSDHQAPVGATTSAQVRITRLGLTDQQVYSGVASMTRQTLPGDAWEKCCNWPVGLELEIPSEWRSGYYRAEFRGPAGDARSVTFVVKNRTPIANGLVMQVPFDTMQAYNSWGGKSAYDFNSSNGVKAQRVSLLRPTHGAEDVDHILGVITFIRWAEAQNIALDYIASADMQLSGALLPWKVFITVGHDEYWSADMRGELDRHIDSGRHAAIFSGNTMWWRTHRQADAWGRQNGRLDAERQSGTPGANWYEFDPEARTIGASFFKGGFLNKYSGAALANLPYTVHRPGHWSLVGTGLAAGSTFGSNVRTEGGTVLGIHAYESDGLDFVDGPDGLPRPTGADGAPLNTEIIATTQLHTATPAVNGWDVPANMGINPPNLPLIGKPGGWATMTSFVRNGGIVFNIGTTDYYKVLSVCTNGPQSAECRIARNVINHMLAN